MPIRHVARLLAIAGIIVIAWVSWSYLAWVIQERTDQASAKLGGTVAGLWGGKQLQAEPFVVLRTSPFAADNPDPAACVPDAPSLETRVPLKSSEVQVALALSPRRKGLLWYSTYRATVSGSYSFVNDSPAEAEARILLPLPGSGGAYDDFQLAVTGREVETLRRVQVDGVDAIETYARCQPGERLEFEVRYITQGLDEWRYGFGHGAGNGAAEAAPSATGSGQVHDFTLVATTDFEAVDFPPTTMSPTTIEPQPGGTRLTWKYANLLGGRDLAVAMPQRLNPGPLAARMARFAPVSLIFFLGVLFFVAVLRGLPLHPVHYAFLSASFFAFHLLFAHLVDHLDLSWSFAIASLVSVVLVVSYLRIVVSPRFAFLEAGGLQLLYLVLFSLAHFFEGWTGLTVTIGAVVTLFVVMQLTARVDWTRVFPERRGGKESDAVA